ncbi:MAG: Trp biosynthesis-associated membrane protein [Kibdelosporangium sp.]
MTALLLGGAAALWGSSRLDWTAGVPGADQVAALVPLALLYLAGIAGALATSGWPRRAVGVLLAVTGLAAGWLAVDGAFNQGQASGVGLLARGLALLAGIVVVGAGVVLARAGHRMPRLGANYQTPAAAKAEQTEDKELWRALTEGKDPTV